MWEALIALSGRDFLVGVLLLTSGGQAWYILRLLRRLSCSEELSRRANEHAIASANETSRILLHGFAAAVRPVLSDLESERVVDWQLDFPDDPNETPGSG